MEKDFQDYVQRIRNSKSNTSVSIPDDLKLDFYKFYKQATLGDCTVPEPSLFSFADNAKWKAWNSLKGMSKEDAMIAYIRYAKQYV